jgi:hypothetical protein
MLRILIIADLSQSAAAMLADSVEAFQRWSRHAITLLKSGVPQLAIGDLDTFDAIIIHYSVFVEQETHLPKAARAVLVASRAIKVVWQQDEYRNVEGLAKAITDIRARIVLTSLPLEAVAQVYGSRLGNGQTFLSIFTGYVSDRMLSYKPASYRERPLDIGFRGRVYPVWHGKLGIERVRIAREVQSWAQARGLICDISVRERDRLYGQSWTNFLNRSKATLATESGANVFDLDGSLPRRVWRFILRHPLASDIEIADATFGPLDGLVDYAQISPRLFEAISARSLLLLSPGYYSGLVVPGRHALSVEPGGANADEIVEIIRDSRRAADLIEAAYSEILLRPELHERAFVRMVDDVIERTVEIPRKHPSSEQETLAKFATKNPDGRQSAWRRGLSNLTRAVLDWLPPRAGRFFESLVGLALFELRKLRRRSP